MADDQLQTRLTEMVGRRSVLADGRVAIPSTVGHVAAVARLCSETATPMAVSSGGGDSALAPRGGLLLSLNRLTAITVDVAAGVVRAEAGASLVTIRGAVEREGQRILGLPAQTIAEHVGGVIVRGEVPRQAVVGVSAVLATGEVVQWGGMIARDVVGYDIAGLLLGSGGRLGIVVAVDLRLVPSGWRGDVETSSRPRQQDASVVESALNPNGLLRPR